MKFTNLKAGIIISIVSLLGLTYVLINQNLNLIEKIILCVLSIIIIAFGILLESPVLRYLKEGEEHLEEEFETTHRF